MIVSEMPGTTATRVDTLLSGRGKVAASINGRGSGGWARGRSGRLESVSVLLARGHRGRRISSCSSSMRRRGRTIRTRHRRPRPTRRAPGHHRGEQVGLVKDSRF